MTSIEYGVSAGALPSGPQTQAGLSIQRRRRLAVAGVSGVIGLVAIVAGWIGVSGTRMISDQLAFIASGGILGLFLVALAGAIVLADFMTEQQRQLAEMQQLLTVLVRREGIGLGGPPASAGEGLRPDAALERAAATGGHGRLITIRGSRRVHDQHCQLVVGKDHVEEVSAVDAVGAGLQPCAVCKPAVEAVTAG